MKAYRSIQHILPPPAPHMVGDGFRVHNFFPTGLGGDYYRMSPFFLLDYGSKIEFEPSEHARGVGVHPHRGFETVTIAFHGSVAHHDSAGNKGIIEPGDVQWMTAGSGVLHKEYHAEAFRKSGGPFQMVQLWVNLPAKYKMTAPSYQSISSKDLGVHQLENNWGRIEVVAGNFRDTKGPAKTFSPMHVSIGRIKKGGSAEFVIPEQYNTCMLCLEGNLKINEEKEIPADYFALLANDGDTFRTEALTDCVFLVLAGEPIKETLVPYGPFLMNSKQEILQAYEDLHNGKFGVLEE